MMTTFEHSFHQQLLEGIASQQITSMPFCRDGLHFQGQNGVLAIAGDQSGTVEYLIYDKHITAYVPSSLGYPAYYPVPSTTREEGLPLALLMDLDGTTVHSETFWMWVIEKVVQDLLDKPAFAFTSKDEPFISGHSVSQHLTYCVDTYCPGKTFEEARRLYFKHTRHEMAEILAGRGRKGAFTPAPNLKEFLLEVKAAGIRIGLVTSGLYEKAYPEILSAFQTLDMGLPEDFYDCIISAGYPLIKGTAGTLGELSPKPHPWLYAEAGCVGLQIPFERHGRVIGVEDSAAGLHAIRLAGYVPIALEGGNIKASGALPFADKEVKNLEALWRFITRN